MRLHAAPSMRKLFASRLCSICIIRTCGPMACTCCISQAECCHVSAIGPAGHARCHALDRQHLLERLDTNAEARHAKVHICTEPAHIECPWVCLHGHFRSLGNAKAAAKRIQDLLK